MPETVIDSLTKVPEEYVKLVNRARLEIGDELLTALLTHISDGDFKWALVLKAAWEKP